MIFGSKTGYGKGDLILQPSHLQVCNEIDARRLKKTVQHRNRPCLRAIEPNRRPHSIRRVENPELPRSPDGIDGLSTHQRLVAEAVIIPVMGPT